MLKKIYTLSILLTLFSTTSIFAQESCDDYLSRTDTNLFNKAGEKMRLTGVNWFGFETSNKAPHGLWSRDYKSMLDQIKAVGFNSIRMPWSNEIMANNGNVNPSSITIGGTDPVDGTNPMNNDLTGLTSLQVMDKIVNYAGSIGLKIMLDNHSREADGYLNEDLWYTNTFSEQDWIDDWVTMATRYAGNDAVIALDLNNEPHGSASWGTSNPSTDWNKAAERCANAIHAVNPDVLIVVEGIGDHSDGSTYWWGGNLRGARTHPVNITDNSKLVYSPHEYGPEVHNQPWFSDASFPNNMPAIIDTAYGFVMSENRGHILVGEFGIKEENAFNGKAKQWFEAFLNHMGNKASWTFWCMNPNSGDTGGILADDWSTVNQWKVDLIAPYFAPPIVCNGLTTGIQNQKETNISLYPNPANDIINISSSINYFEWEVYSSLGALVLNGNGNQINIKTLNTGLYYVKVNDIFKKVIKE